jgi:hypothetical protein
MHAGHGQDLSAAPEHKSLLLLFFRKEDSCLSRFNSLRSVQIGPPPKKPLAQPAPFMFLFRSPN